MAPDLYMSGPLNEDPAGFYVPVAQGDVRFMSIAIRTQGNPVEFTQAIRDDVMAVDADMPIYWTLTMADVIHEETWFYWVFGTLFAVFGGVALLLTGLAAAAVPALRASRIDPMMALRRQ